MLGDNFLLLTYDSCRYDVYRDARTPVVDGYAVAQRAWTSATFTYPAHQAFFVGILPNVDEPVPYYNRFTRQLVGVTGVGETNVVKEGLVQVASTGSLLDGLRSHGYRTVGAGAMTWFQQDTLTQGFDAFRFTGSDADAQIDFLLDELPADRPFFGFVNFGETHHPFRFKGKKERCPVDVRARVMTWPPERNPLVPVGRESPAYDHQMQCVEFLDSRLPRLFSALPGNTIVIVCADHGECFGEDGYWGHGVNHTKVYEVPLAIFRLDRRSLFDS